MVEVLVAAIILIIGTLAVFTAFDASTHATARSEATQVAQNRAQQELEKIRAADFSTIALTSAPAFSENPKDPRNRVLNGTFLMNPGGSPADYATMVVNGGTSQGGATITGGTIHPGPQSFKSGDISGDIYRYVVWRDEPKCPATTCPGYQDFKRVVIVVRLDDTAVSDPHRPAYIDVHSDFVDPRDSVISDTPTGGASQVTAQQFWLTDTPCESDGSTIRQGITGDHALHNTLGRCSDGPHTGSTAGAPDTLIPSQAPDPEPDDPGIPLQYDYSNDTYLEPNPNTDKGIQIQRQDVNGCSYTPSGTNPESKVHRWVTDPMASTFELNNDASLYFFSRTINQASHSGRLCAYLFIRSTNGAGVATDSLIINQSTGLSYFTYQPGGTGLWPTNFPSPANKVTMQFADRTVAAGQQLGLAVSVDRAVTPASLEFMFDHPDYATRLEVGTTTPLG
jgi:type II secretory pathway pseudopilin PulG